MVVRVFEVVVGTLLGGCQGIAMLLLMYSECLVLFVVARVFGRLPLRCYALAKVFIVVFNAVLCGCEIVLDGC